jgi:hypothetical protein
MSTSNEHADLDGYLDGALDAMQARRVEDHLDDCAVCREEVISLQEIQSYLREVPPEMLLDGPPDGADLLLQRTLRQVRSEASRARGGRGALAVTASLAVAAAAVFIGVLIGRASVDTRPVESAGPASPTASATAVPGTRFASFQDPGSGARLTVRVEPATGWVRVNAAVTGIPAGAQCRLIVVGRDARRETAGSWLVSPMGAKQGTTLNGSALVDPADVTAVLIETISGRQYVKADI